MAYTYQYSINYTWTWNHGGVFQFASVAPPPALHPTAMTVTVGGSQTGGGSCNLVQDGGTGGGGYLIGCTWGSGASGSTGSGTSVIPSNATGVHLQISENGYGSGSSYSVLYQVSVTYSDAVPPPPCQYGTQPASTASAVTLITDAALTAAAATFGAPWLAYLFAPLIGYAIDSGLLCGSGPPAMGTIDNTAWFATIQQKLTWVESMLWYSVCQCTPAPSGSAPPLAYQPPSLTQPTGWPVPVSYTCSNTDVCTTLELILKRLDELNTSQQINVNQTTTIVNSSPPLAYKVGASHPGLTGNGSLSIAKCVGIRLAVTALPPGKVLPGIPPYYWDVGWMSASDGGAMLQEHRITRTSAEWFPFEMTLASTWGYYLNDGVTATMTELVPAT